MLTTKNVSFDSRQIALLNCYIFVNDVDPVDVTRESVIINVKFTKRTYTNDSPIPLTIDMVFMTIEDLLDYIRISGCCPTPVLLTLYSKRHGGLIYAVLSDYNATTESMRLINFPESTTKGWIFVEDLYKYIPHTLYKEKIPFGVLYSEDGCRLGRKLATATEGDIPSEILKVKYILSRSRGMAISALFPSIYLYFKKYEQDGDDTIFTFKGMFDLKNPTRIVKNIRDRGAVFKGCKIKYIPINL